MIGEGKAKKVLVLGIDGMDPRLTRRFVDEGAMPNTAQFLQRGSAREDLVMMGDDLYKGVCAHCGKPLYDGDTVYKSAFGTYCVECFFEYVIDDLFTVA